MRNRTAIALLGAVAFAMTAGSACGTPSRDGSSALTSPVVWYLTVPVASTATQLEIVAGASTCARVAEAIVTETAETATVVVSATDESPIGPDGARGCNGAGRAIAMTVDLDVPLGDRTLEGCGHPDQPCTAVTATGPT